MRHPCRKHGFASTLSCCCRRRPQDLRLFHRLLSEDISRFLPQGAILFFRAVVGVGDNFCSTQHKTGAQNFLLDTVYPERKLLAAPLPPNTFSRVIFVDLPVGDRASARLRVLLGQPVKLGGASFGVIRIALGADMLIDAMCRGSPPLAEEHVTAMGENGGVTRLLAQVNPDVIVSFFAPLPYSVTQQRQSFPNVGSAKYT